MAEEDLDFFGWPDEPEENDGDGDGHGDGGHEEDSATRFRLVADRVTEVEKRIREVDMALQQVVYLIFYFDGDDKHGNLRTRGTQ